MFARCSKCTDAVHTEHSLTLRGVAVPGEIPRTERVEDAPRVDDPRRHLVAREREVLDLELIAGCGRRLQRDELPGFPTDVDGNRAGRAERRLELAERRRQRPFRIRPWHGEQRAPGGEQRHTLGRTQTQRTVEVLREADVDRPVVGDPQVDQAIRGVRREPAHREELEVALQLELVDFEASRQLGDRRPGMLGNPRHEREHALEARADQRARAHVAATASGRSQSMTIERSSAGASTSACSRSSSTQVRKASWLTTERPTTTDPSSRRSTTASSPSSSTTQAARRVDQDLGVERLRIAIRQRVVAQQVSGIDAHRRFKGARLTELDAGVDPIDPKCSRRVAIAVSPDDVPVPETVHDPVRLELARVTSVGEAHDATLRNRIEEIRECRRDLELG